MNIYIYIYTYIQHNILKGFYETHIVTYTITYLHKTRRSKFFEGSKCRAPKHNTHILFVEGFHSNKT